MRITEQRRTQTFVPNEKPRRGSFGPKFRACLADSLCVSGSGASEIGLRFILATLATTLGVIAFASTPALAAKEYLTPGTPFGSTGEAAGQFKEPTGVAVNASTEPLTEPAAGDVYVADTGNNRVEQFSSAGVFIAVWGWGVSDGKAEFEVCTVSCKAGIAGSGAGQFDTPEAIAVDDSTSSLDPSRGDVYIGNSTDGVVEKFSAAGALLGALTEAGGELFGELHGLAVDSAGHLWVYHGEAFAKNVAEFSAAGVLEKTFEIEHGLGPGIAVDSKGAFYVDRANGTVLKYDATGAELGEIAEGTGARALAVNSSTGNLLVDEAEGNSIALYPPFAEQATPLESFPGEAEPLAESLGVAVGAEGAAYVGQRTANNVLLFAHTVFPRGVTEPASFVSEGSETMRGSVNLEGKEDLECTFEYGASAAEPGGYENKVPCEQSAGQINTSSGAEHKTTVPVTVTLAGLALDRLFHFRLIVLSTGGQGAGNDSTFFTETKPVVTGETASEVGSTEATVSAQIDAAGSPTTYQAEYVTAAQFTASGFAEATAVPAPPGLSLGAPQSPTEVQVNLTGLQPNTEYDYRFTATNELGTTHGEANETFKTPGSTGAASLTLPDNRAYELVSPLDNVSLDYLNVASKYNEAGAFTPESDWPFRAAAGGGAVAYQGLPPAEGGNGSEVGDYVGNQFLATRNAGTGRWEASDITPTTAGQESHAEFYEAFSPDLTLGIIHSINEETNEANPLASGASPCDALYTHTGSDVAAGYGALFTATPAPKPSGCGEHNQQFAGGNAGTETVAKDSHLLLQTPVALTAQSEPAAWITEGEELGGGEANLYDSTGGKLHSVNVSNDGTPAVNATFGGPVLYAPESSYVVASDDDNGNDYSDVVSADGSRVFWSTVERVKGEKIQKEDHARALYVRENDTQPQSPVTEAGACTVAGDACTVQLDTAQTGAEGASGAGQFWTASADGSKVFFTDCHRLTVSSTAEEGGGCEHLEHAGVPVMTGNDLYECELPPEAGRPCKLTDLTVDDHEAADVQGVVGASEDGEYVYFVAAGALAPGATPKICEPLRLQLEDLLREREEGRITFEKYEELSAPLEQERHEEEEGKTPAHTGCNLYLAHHGEPLKFIATLSPADDELPAGAPGGSRVGDWSTNLGTRTAEVTPHGQGLVFVSRRSVTGYDNATHVGELTFPMVEVFVYDAGTGRLACASCQPSGAPPLSPLDEQEPLPTSRQNTYQPRWISADGDEVFFDTPEPLVSQDSNRNYLDVYEWEREGTGSCPVATGRYGGCDFLLSGGISLSPSMFVDASADGGEVFFETRARLVPRDHDENLKLYDARACTSASPCFHETPVACEGAGCQGSPPAPPIFATPSSVTFAGPGNFPPPATVKKTTVKKTVKCKKNFVKKKVKKKETCVKKKSKKPKKAKKAGHNGRGK